jgi:hypothetical protein
MYEAKSTSALIDLVSEQSGEMSLALATTLYNRLRKSNAAHQNDVAPADVCQAQGLDQGSSWLECVKARISA